MAFTLEQRNAYYRAHPEKRCALQARWRARHRSVDRANASAYRRRQSRKARAGQIAGALASLLSAHRLRVIGVEFNKNGDRSGFDSWATK